MEGGLDAGAGQPFEEGFGCGLISGGFEDYGALADLGVSPGGDADEGSEVAEVGGAGDGEREEASLGVAGFGELGGLGDVFADDEFGGDDGGEIEVLEGAGGCEAVGSVERVGDGDLGDAGAAEGIEREGLGGGVFAGPKDEDAAGVGRGRFGGGEVVGDEGFGVNEVGGEEKVLGIAVFELLGERGRGAEGGNDFNSGGVLVEGCQRRKDGLEVRSRGNVQSDRSLGAGCGVGHREEYRGK